MPVVHFQLDIKECFLPVLAENHRITWGRAKQKKKQPTIITQWTLSSKTRTQTDRYAFELRYELRVRAGENLIGQRRNVHPAIAFACDPKVVRLELREFVEPTNEEVVIVNGGDIVVGIVPGRRTGVAEANTCRLFNVDHTGILIPREWIGR